MYYQNYEDYMRQVLGYPINDPNIYEKYDYRNEQTYEDTYSYRNQVVTNMSEEEIRNCYPDIYHLIYPMICKVCDSNTEPITKELIDKMTTEVYNAIEDTNTVVNIRVNTPRIDESSSTIVKDLSNASSRVQKATRENNRTFRTSREINDSYYKENREKEVSTKEKRQSNSNLQDLIRILLLFRLFGNRQENQKPPRPPFPSEPGRPPFPGGVGRPPMGFNRPPVIQPRDYSNYLEF